MSTTTIPDFERIISVLVDSKIEFILVGGIAATAHGSARSTYDVDIVYNRNSDNIKRLAKLLSPFNPYLRGAPHGLPFQLDQETITRGLNFTLTTTLGDLDLLGELTGGGSYNDLIPHCIELEIFNKSCFCLNLQKLIEVKRAAGRPKDLEVIAELESIFAEQNMK